MLRESYPYYLNNEAVYANRDLPVVDDSILDPDADYRMRLQALLNTQQYPAPLRLLFFWRDQWQLKSEWFEWSLER